jgi:hypothetical protein
MSGSKADLSDGVTQDSHGPDRAVLHSLRARLSSLENEVKKLDTQNDSILQDKV